MFTLLCAYPTVNKLETTSFHPQTRGKFEDYNMNFLCLFWLYIAYNYQNWDIFAQLPEYTKKFQVPRSSNKTKFRLTVRRLSLGPKISISRSALLDESSNATNHNVLSQEFLHQVASMHYKVSNTLAKY